MELRCSRLSGSVTVRQAGSEAAALGFTDRRVTLGAAPAYATPQSSMLEQKFLQNDQMLMPSACHRPGSGLLFVNGKRRAI